MAIKPIMLIGEPALRETAKEVPSFEYSRLQSILTDLKDTMYSEELAGISAPQIGESIAVFVTEIRETKYRKGEQDEFRLEAGSH